MIASQAQDVLRRHNLFDRKTSRRVLNAIALKREEELQSIKDTRIQKIWPELKDGYWRIRNRMPAGACRNRPFYEMISARYHDFNWKSCPGGTDIDFQFAGIKPSLLSLLAGLVPEDSTSTSARWRLGPLTSSIVDRTSQVFGSVGMVRGDLEHERAVGLWLEKGLGGEPLTIVSPVCPDYAVEDGSVAVHRFTFDGVGDGIGITARRLFEALPPLHDLLRRDLGIQLTHYVCPGDFEAFSEETNARIGITEEHFLRQLSRSREAILHEAPVEVESCLFTDFCDGKQGWNAIHRQQLQSVLGGMTSHPWLEDVALGRAGLYDRWFGVSNRETSFYVNIVLRQGAEYAAMGAAVEANKTLINPLILGADDHRMGLFYRLSTSAPVLYLNRNYE
jgi:hypothetical protein